MIYTYTDLGQEPIKKEIVLNFILVILIVVPNTAFYNLSHTAPPLVSQFIQKWHRAAVLEENRRCFVGLNSFYSEE